MQLQFYRCCYRSSAWSSAAVLCLRTSKNCGRKIQQGGGISPSSKAKRKLQSFEKKTHPSELHSNEAVLLLPHKHPTHCLLLVQAATALITSKSKTPLSRKRTAAAAKHGDKKSLVDLKTLPPPTSFAVRDKRQAKSAQAQTQKQQSLHTAKNIPANRKSATD